MKVNNISQLFYKLTNIKPYRCNIIKDGITNKNYKIFTHQGIYVLRMPRKEMIAINYLNQEKVLKKVKDLNVEVIYYDNTGILITSFVKHNKKECIDFNLVVNKLKTLHSLDSSDIDDFDPFINLKEYKKVVNETLFNNEDKIINKAKTLYDRHLKVLCHNDVLLANFIKTSSSSYLIDYEYAGKNIALFDVVSFLSENNIDDENLQHKFLKMYYGKVDETLLNEVKIMYSFLDVLWTYWAKAMYIKYNEEVFNDIALEKTSRYNLIDDTY